jgi:hypothetical protein
MIARFSFALSLALLLAGCGDADKRAKPEGDAAVSGALDDQIMVDPALDAQNQARAGMAGGGAAAAGIPPEQRNPEAIAAAIADATRLAGGSIRPAPTAKTGPQSAKAVTAGQLAYKAPHGGDCVGKVEYSAIWAARLPEALAVYPRGHVQEAAGTDQNGCRLRVVNFVTPVGVSDVIDYYYTRLTAAGFDAEHRSEGKDAVLGGSEGAAAYLLYVRTRSDGLTEADLISNGG